MVHLSPSLLLLLLCCLPLLSSAFLMRGGRSRASKRLNRHQQEAGSSRHDPLAPFQRPLSFKNHFHSVTVAHKHRSMYLECEVGGTPAPTIHWLKDGVRIPQSAFETIDDESAVFEGQQNEPGTPMLALSSTASRLYLDCPTHRDQGEYTCVAETPVSRKVQSTILRVESRHYQPDEDCVNKVSGNRGEPARIYMWSVSRLELEGRTVQFFCRATGYPEPIITWFDNFNNTLPDASSQFTIEENGDLVVRDITWFDNMGHYRCRAENVFGSHSVETFLYPTTLETANNLPV